VSPVAQARGPPTPTRLLTPTSGSEIIERTRLDDQYRAATGGVVRVLAPGGYGKSTLVARWAQHDERVVRWIDLEPIDNDPLVFGHSLNQALSDLDPTDLDPTGPNAPAGHDTARLLGGCTNPFVLVLDDIHHLEGEASLTLLNSLIEHLPPASTLVIVGRAHHRSASVARFRLDPGVIDVGADALAFDLAETEQMLKSMGVESNIDDLTDLADQFEGWPAGLRLAGMAVSNGRHGLDSPLDQLGSLDHITGYITEEWFGALDADDQRLLMCLGCLGRFSGESCAAILGLADASSTLHRLCREQLVLFAMDQRGEWYRLHPLLQRWLCVRLRSQDLALWSKIHETAARWWEQRGDVDLAIEYAVAGEHLELCEQLIATHTPLYAVRGMHTTVQRWLTHLGADRIRASPHMCIVAAVIAIDVGDGEAALNWSRLAWREVDRADDAAVRLGDQFVLQAEALQAALEPRPAADLISVGAHAFALLPGGPWRAFAGLALGVNRYLSGDAGAIDTLNEALFENEVGDWSIMNAGAAAALAIVLDLEGRQDEAAGLCTRALRLLDTRRGETYPATGLTMAIASLIESRRGRHQLASEHLLASRRRLDMLESCAPWYRILGLVTLIRTCLLLDDAQTAGDLLRQLDLSMAIQDDTTPFAARTGELRHQAQAATRLLSGRSWSLTAAELRVVQFLPTNLSLAEIATRLFVSRNTVKSHAAAIYRKLGATSRSNAVLLARSAGLIEERPAATHAAALNSRLVSGPPQGGQRVQTKR
jgi:LuxR family maltose regulon positive regulatory protein